jgi:hypothetical protein
MKEIAMFMRVFLYLFFAMFLAHASLAETTSDNKVSNSDISVSVFQGSLNNTCAPWDGAAYAIKLNNGITASVWEAMPSETNWVSKTYVADDVNSSHAGGAALVKCGADGKDCQRLNGIITLEKYDGIDASGMIEVQKPSPARYQFRVRVQRVQMFCG